LNSPEIAKTKYPHKEAARRYFKNNLQGTYVTTKLGPLGSRDIHFTGRTWSEMSYKMENDPLKALLIEDLPTILSPRFYKGEADKMKARKEDFDHFHYFEGTIRKMDNGVEREVWFRVTVGRRVEALEDYEAYHLAHDKKSLSINTQALMASPLPALDKSNVTCVCSSLGGPHLVLLATDKAIDDFFEVVNFEVENLGREPQFFGVFAGLNRIRH